MTTETNTASSSFSFKKVSRIFSNGGFLLMIVAILALIIANSPLGKFFDELWQMPLIIHIGHIKLFTHHGEPLSLISFINDALMAVFFFSVGLEIKREFLIGELSSPRKAILPIVAAMGGMIIPILVFFSISHEYPASNGLPIPMATDIAFSLGILSLLGKRVPISLKVFLTTLAVADDIGGIIIIAAKYSTDVNFVYLLMSLGILAILFIGGHFRIHAKMFYLVLGFIVWTLFLQSGIHPTIAGVLLAFTIPATPKLDVRRFVATMQSELKKFPVDDAEEGKEIILTSSQMDSLKYIDATTDRVVCPLQEMENDLHPVVCYLIMPLFAFANAGVNLSGIAPSDIFQGVSLSIILGLFLGKFIGIASFTFAYIKMGFSTLPSQVTFKQIAGVSFLGGIGFTVSLFMANLSYGGIPEVGATLLNQAKLGIVIGSFMSGLAGYLYLKRVLPKEPAQDNN